MSYLDMFDGVVNSPTTITSGPISASATSIPLIECKVSVIPPAPNVITLGNGEDAETVYYTGKTANSGPGEITGCVRGFQGIAFAWPTGTPVSRVFTEYDQKAIKNNLLEIKNTAVFPATGETITEDTVPLWDSTKKALKSGPSIGNGANQVLKTDANGKVPATILPPNAVVLDTTTPKYPAGDGSDLTNLYTPGVIPFFKADGTYLELPLNEMGTRMPFQKADGSSSDIPVRSVENAQLLELTNGTNDASDLHNHASLYPTKAQCTLSGLGAAPGYNYIINPCFEINQRVNASVNSNGAFPVDRWKLLLSGSTVTASQQLFSLGQTDTPGDPKNFLRTVVTSVTGTSNFAFIHQRIESVRTLAGKGVTLSFDGKADTAKPIAVEFVQYFGTGGSPSPTVYSIGLTKVNLSSSWSKQSVTVDIPGISGKTIGTNGDDFLQVIFWFDAGSDFNARTGSLGQQSGTFDLANVKLEEGLVATPCIVPQFNEELQKCMRYLYTIRSEGSNTILALGTTTTTTVGLFPIAFPIRMRSPPTFSYSEVGTNTGLRVNDTNSSITTTSLSQYVADTGLSVLNATITGGTLYRPIVLQFNGTVNSSAWVRWDAEL